MAISVQSVFQAVNAIVVQATSGTFPIIDFNRNSETVQINVYNRLRAINGDNIEVINELLPFKAIYNPPQNITGIYSYPPDYFRYIVAPMVVQGQQEQTGNIVSDDEWAWRSSSRLVSRIRNPIINFQNGFIRIEPTTGWLRMYYFKKLIPAVYGATPDANGDPIYNAGTSTDFMFDDAQFGEIVVGIATLLAVNVEKSVILQYFNQYQNQ